MANLDEQILAAEADVERLRGEREDAFEKFIGSVVTWCRQAWPSVARDLAQRAAVASEREGKAFDVERVRSLRRDVEVLVGNAEESVRACCATSNGEPQPDDMAKRAFLAINGPLSEAKVRQLSWRDQTHPGLLDDIPRVPAAPTPVVSAGRHLVVTDQAHREAIKQVGVLRGERARLGALNAWDAVDE